MDKAAAGYYIGVDGGGTNTRMLLVDATGQKLGEGHAGSTNRNDHPRSEVLSNMQRAYDEATSALPKGAAVAAMQLGLGGVCTDADKADVVDICRSLRGLSAAAKVSVENDTAIGLSGGLSGRPGLVLIAGTGSACYGRSESGKTWLCGGWGPLVDDAGSGYWIGLQALCAAVRAEDGRLDGSTAIKPLVFRDLGLKEPREFLDRVHNRRLERAQIAALAPQVTAAAGRGDACATEILERGAAGLAEMVAVTATQLFGKEPCDLILVGGLALSGPPYQDLITSSIRRCAPQVVLREPEMSPVQGAALEALRLGGVAWTPALLAKVRHG